MPPPILPRVPRAGVQTTWSEEKNLPCSARRGLQVEVWGLSCYIKTNQLSAGVRRLSGCCLNCAVFLQRWRVYTGLLILYFRSCLYRWEKRHLNDPRGSYLFDIHYRNALGASPLRGRLCSAGMTAYIYHKSLQISMLACSRRWLPGRPVLLCIQWGCYHWPDLALWRRLKIIIPPRENQ